MSCSSGARVWNLPQGVVRGVECRSPLIHAAEAEAFKASPPVWTMGTNRSWQMDVHQLELFLAVMDSPSMTRAAEKIHLSPGAVSLQLHNLADELHTELFVRRG